jgi:hypothetical protein
VLRIAAVRPRGSRKKSAPAAPGDRLLKNAIHPFDPNLPDEFTMLNGGFLMIKVPVTDI